jgi:hypothetical protein
MSDSVGRENPDKKVPVPELNSPKVCLLTNDTQGVAYDLTGRLILARVGLPIVVYLIGFYGAYAVACLWTISWAGAACLRELQSMRRRLRLGR